jgi:NADH-quinone oxidoreductase subunit N
MDHQYRFGIIVHLLPIALLLGTAAVIGVIAVVRQRTDVSLHRWLAVIGFSSSLVAALIAFSGMRLNSGGVGLDTMAGGVLADRLDIYIEVTAAALGILVSLAASSAWRELHGRAPALYALLLVTVAAVDLTAAQHEMAALIVGVTLLLVGLVSMAALAKSQAVAVEAALKQLVTLGIGAGILLQGLVLVYGATGSTDLTKARGAFTSGASLQGLAVALCLLGITAFLGAAPLHRWMVNAAQALPGAVAAAVIGFGGLGGAVLLVRVTAGGFGPSMRLWFAVASALAAIAVLVPAVTALVETDVRRLAGRLATLQAGLLLTAALGSGIGGDGVSAGGVTALLFAAALFALASITTLVALGALAAAGVTLDTAGLRGLGRRAPGEAMALALGLLALAGVPPLAGFVARIFIASAAINGGYAWVGVVALLGSALGAVPVIRMLVGMYTDDNDLPLVPHGAPRLARLALAFCAILGVAATLLAQPLLAVAAGGASGVH